MKQDDSSLFCSELIAYILNNQFELYLEPNNIVPSDFMPFNNKYIDKHYRFEITYLKKE